jgi:hypothetical protein
MESTDKSALDLASTLCGGMCEEMQRAFFDISTSLSAKVRMAVLERENERCAVIFELETLLALERGRADANAESVHIRDELHSSIETYRIENERLVSRIYELEEESKSMRKVSNLVMLQNEVTKLREENQSLLSSAKKKPARKQVAARNDEADPSIEGAVAGSCDGTLSAAPPFPGGTDAEPAEPAEPVEEPVEEPILAAAPPTVENEVAAASAAVLVSASIEDPAPAEVEETAALGVPVEKEPESEEADAKNPPAVVPAVVAVERSAPLKMKTVRGRAYMAARDAMYEINEDGSAGALVAELVKAEGGKTKIAWMVV